MFSFFNIQIEAINLRFKVYFLIGFVIFELLIWAFLFVHRRARKKNNKKNNFNKDYKTTKNKVNLDSINYTTIKNDSYEKGALSKDEDVFSVNIRSGGDAKNVHAES